MATKVQAQEVTREQINACQRWEDGNGKVFYQVQSESDPTGCYKVQWNARYHVLSCNCPAGAEGRACKHLHWVMAAEQEYKQERRRLHVAEQARLEADTQVQREIAEQTVSEGQARLAEIDAAMTEEEKAIERLVSQGVDRETATRVATAKPTNYSERRIKQAQQANATQHKPFSLLK